MRGWELPASGPGGYLGRAQSVATLERWLRAGAGVSLIGGAKIGKSSLLGEVARSLGSVSVMVSAAEISSRNDAVREIASRLAASDRSPGGRAFVLVDDAGALAGPAGRKSLDELAAVAAEGAGGRGVAICLAGTRRWRDATLHPGCPLPARGIRLRSFPMAAWDRRAAGSLIRSLAPDASSEQVGRLIRLSGNHPFLLKGLLSRWPDLDGALSSCAPDFERAFVSWSDEMAPTEPGAGGPAGVDARPLFHYLLERGSPVSFDGARRALKRVDLKREADLLRTLGVIDRRLHGEEATAVLHAACGLFNEWYRGRLMSA